MLVFAAIGRNSPRSGRPSARTIERKMCKKDQPPRYRNSGFALYSSILRKGSVLRGHVENEYAMVENRFQRVRQQPAISIGGPKILP